MKCWPNQVLKDKVGARAVSLIFVRNYESFAPIVDGEGFKSFEIIHAWRKTYLPVI